MKSIFLLIGLLLFSKVNSQNSVCSAGGDFSNNYGSISHTIGQNFNLTTFTEDYSVVEGMQQVFEYQVLLKSSKIKALLFPNPIVKEKFLKVRLSKDPVDEVYLTIFDTLGKKVFRKRLYEIRENLDVGSLHSGIYLIRITENEKFLSSTKLIKE